MDGNDKKYCMSCENIIQGTYQIRKYSRKEYVLCQRCSQEKRCEACDRPESVAHDVQLERIDHGYSGKIRYQCRECEVDAIDNLKDAKHILNDCFEFIENKIGLTFPTRNVKLAFSDVIGDDTHSCAFQGDGQCSTRVSKKELEDGWIEHIRELVEIKVLRGLHYIYLCRTLCHELIHYWLGIHRGNPCMRQKQNHNKHDTFRRNSSNEFQANRLSSSRQCRICPSKPLNEKVAEGLCELSALLYLQHYIFEKTNNNNNNNNRGNTKYFNDKYYTKHDNHNHQVSVANTALDVLLNNKIAEYAEGIKLVQNQLIAFEKDFNNNNYNKNQYGTNNNNTFNNNALLPYFFFHVVIYGNLYNAGSRLELLDLKHENMFCPCVVCGTLVEPISNIEMRNEISRSSFTFIVKDLQVCHPSCFQNNIAKKCEICNKNLMGSSVIDGKNVHEECFLKVSERCARCGEPLWEKEEIEMRGNTKYNNNNNKNSRRSGSFVKRTSLTDRGEKVHLRCSDKCKYCAKPLGEYPSVKGKQLHQQCFLKYQKEVIGDVCKICNDTLWVKNESNGGLARRTYYSDLHGGEVHYSCVKCVVCNIGFDDNDNTSFMAKEMCHRDCFIRLSEMKGEVCFYCNRSLWNRTKDGFNRSGIIKEPKSNRLIHAKCGPKCNYCLKPLYLEEFLDNEENKVHMKCFVNYRADVHGEICGICSRPLWEEKLDIANTNNGNGRRKSTGFKRRSSFSKDYNADVHIHCLEEAKRIMPNQGNESIHSSSRRRNTYM